MQEYSGLREVRTTGASGVLCPVCRNYLEVVPNGFFGGDLFYCSKDKRVFSFQLRDITKMAGDKYLESCEDTIAIKDLKSKINKGNYKKIIDCL